MSCAFIHYILMVKESLIIANAKSLYSVLIINVSICSINIVQKSLKITKKYVKGLTSASLEHQASVVILHSCLSLCLHNVRVCLQSLQAGTVEVLMKFMGGRARTASVKDVLRCLKAHR